MMAGKKGKETVRIIVGVTGASGMPYAVRLLKALNDLEVVETHLIISNAARKVLALESKSDEHSLESLAHTVHDPANMAAGPASGSWRHAGMVICPLSMASLGAIASGNGDNLIHRAADVCLKEGRKLILVPRETPLSRIHLKNMLAVSEAGAVVLPAAPGFYNRPAFIEDIVDQIVGRILDQFRLYHEVGTRWQDG